MKVIHICTSLTGGAGLCAKRIITATRAEGIDAKVIVASGAQEEDWISLYEYPYPWSKIWLIQKFQVLLNMYGLWPRFDRYSRKISKETKKNRAKDVCMTSPVTRFNRLHEHAWVQESDIIHLHWVGNMLDYETFFKNVHKPIVWTVHDENPGLGGFHYTSWRDASTASFRKLENKLLTIKRDAYSHAKNLTLVAISSMMSQFFKQNELLSRFPVTIIHNGIDPEKFQLLASQKCRQQLEIPADAVVFLFVAQNIHEGRKGLNILLQALDSLNFPNKFLLCLGVNEGLCPTASFPIRCVGFISDTESLSLYYSASDYFVMPSSQEAFAQTPMEAMACGTPVVAFPCSGAQDLINDRNGVICSDFTVVALADGIRMAMNRNYNPAAIRSDVVSRFSYDKIARQYISLYDTLLADSSVAD